jgi:hypothetical protein
MYNMHRFLGDDDSVINSRNELWLTTVAGSNAEEERDQQSAAGMFLFCIHRVMNDRVV